MNNEKGTTVDERIENLIETENALHSAQDDLIKEKEKVRNLTRTIKFRNAVTKIIICIILCIVVTLAFKYHFGYLKFREVYLSGEVYQRHDGVGKAYRNWLLRKDYPEVKRTDSGDLIVRKPDMAALSRPRLIYDGIITPGYYIYNGSMWSETIMTITETEEENIINITFEIYRPCDNKELQKYTCHYKVLLSENKTSGMSVDNGDLVIHVDNEEFVVTLINKPDSMPSWVNIDRSYVKIMNFTEGDM